MKYLRTFEENNGPQVGDYVKIYADYFDINLLNFFKIEIGKIVDIKKHSGQSQKYSSEELEYPYQIKFENQLPNNKLIDVGGYMMDFERYEIIKYAPDKEGLKIVDDIKKYNL